MWMLVMEDNRSTEGAYITQHKSKLAAEACAIDMMIQRLTDDDDGEWDNGETSIRFTNKHGDLLFSKVCKIINDPELFEDHTGISFTIMPMPAVMHDMAEELARTHDELTRDVWRWWVTKQAKEALLA